MYPMGQQKDVQMFCTGGCPVQKNDCYVDECDIFLEVNPRNYPYVYLTDAIQTPNWYLPSAFNDIRINIITIVNVQH